MLELLPFDFDRRFESTEVDIQRKSNLIINWLKVDFAYFYKPAYQLSVINVERSTSKGERPTFD